MNSESFDKLSFEDKHKINGILDKEELALLERYVKDLEDECISLRAENDRLESEWAWSEQERVRLESSLDEKCEFYCPLKELCSEIVNEKYKYTTLKYNNLDKVVEDLDRVLTYEV